MEEEIHFFEYDFFDGEAPIAFEDLDITVITGAAVDVPGIGTGYPVERVIGSFRGKDIELAGTGGAVQTIGGVTFDNTIFINDDNGANGSINGIDANGIGFYNNGKILKFYSDGTHLHVGGSSPILIYTDAPCFVAGTNIRVLREGLEADVAVEALAVDDLVVTTAVDGSCGLRPVRWIGHTTRHPNRTSRPWETQPVRVRAGAIEPGVPARDLLVSPGHALRIGEVLINAGELVNGGTIVQEEVDTVVYYHVELDSHDILLADGMPCESYLDDGNRASFSNGADHIRLHGRLDRVSEQTCLPLVKDGPVLAAARTALLARAIDMGWSLEERPDLRIQIGATSLQPVAATEKRAWFVLPDGTSGPVRLRSAAAMINRIAPELADDRRLGVAINELRVDGVLIALDDSMLGQGFYSPEADAAATWRWTDGAAEIALPGQARVIEIGLQMTLATLCEPSAERTVALAG